MEDLGFDTLLYTSLSAQGSSLKGHIQEILAAHPQPSKHGLHGLPPAEPLNLHLHFQRGALVQKSHYSLTMLMIMIMKCHILETAWGSYNLPSPFLLLWMELLVTCCQHEQEKKFSAPKDLQSKDLILHTVVYDCTQAYITSIYFLFAHWLRCIKL